jgi:hypothetical protein
MKMINDVLRETYGEKVYRISLNAGCTCPNRDGTLGTRGCIFCSAGGSGDFAENAALSVTEQIEHGKLRVQKKAPNCRKFIAYFQAYTNTYAPVSVLEPIFMEAINHPDVVILSIATRPDCLGEDILALLKRCSVYKPVWVELGLQTIHERSAIFIRRGFTLECYDEAVHKLNECGIDVITHVILGLPGETAEDMYATIDHIASLPVSGVKLQMLHILEGTDLATYYEENPFHVFTLEEYIDILMGCIERLPEDCIIHRLTGDGPKKLLIAPLWTADKKRVLNAISKYIKQR